MQTSLKSKYVELFFLRVFSGEQSLAFRSESDKDCICFCLLLDDSR